MKKLVSVLLILSLLLMIVPIVSASGLPSNCAEIKSGNPSAADGEYTISINGNSASVFCHNMGGTPKEYLTLVKTGGTANFSYYGIGPNSTSGLTTKYSKVRFDPSTLTVNIGDTTFSMSTGYKRFGYNVYYTNEYATAGDCVRDGSTSGRGNVDLTGTPFYVLPDQFVTAGWNPAGSNVYSSNGQVVNLTGGGYCGSTSPTGSIVLKLGIFDNTAPTTQAALPSTTNTAGWYNSDLTVTLTATDNQSGVKKINYSLNGALYVEVSGSTASVPITADGIHTLRYYAVDNAGNTEQVKSIIVKLDKTAPILTVQLDKPVIAPLDDEKMAVIHATLNASDATSGVASVILTSITSNKIVKDQGEESPKKVNFLAELGTSATTFSVRAEEGYIYTITYTITDNAGNKSTAVSTVSVIEPKENKDGHKGNPEGKKGDNKDSSKKGE